jgi:hypothetical protein
MITNATLCSEYGNSRRFGESRRRLAFPRQRRAAGSASRLRWSPRPKGKCNRQTVATGTVTSNRSARSSAGPQRAHNEVDQAGLNEAVDGCDLHRAPQHPPWHWQCVDSVVEAGTNARTSGSGWSRTTSARASTAGAQAVGGWVGCSSTQETIKLQPGPHPIGSATSIPSASLLSPASTHSCVARHSTQDDGRF